MKRVSKMRLGYFLGFLLIVFLLTLAEYLEVYKGMIPCPLCMVQRVIFILLGAVFFVGMIFRMKKIGFLVVGMLSMLTCIGGILLAGRQVWLQHLPPANLGECGASLSYMFNTFPLMDVFKNIWTGGIECSQHGWAFMYLSFAEWSLIGFLVFFVFAVSQFIRSFKL